ncbi:cellulase family glycosylhydrolase [Actinoplanes sp. NEAU-A12]|uniref:Endoglucanase n=1 Tax=Actinoplanes sandaracinus TaxID=3045177 RepID=A0ABT6WHW9_9ACTN|nr:cellulase family glycosylhydrolase [Actinoplanes sandaracinus]MDI6099324.1 cellulase family glycosylhydrolase [Actinoplanes sandaracinus]
MRSKWWGGLAAVLTAAVAVFVAAQPAQAAAGFTVSGTRIIDGNGNPFLMRGVNHAHTWYPTRTASLADIKTLGANTVRVVLASGHRWTKNEAADVTGVINQCKANRLICVLEVHDTTGYGEQAGAATLAQAVDYWISIKSALAGQENYVILNIGNEPYGNGSATASWTADTKSAITRLRAAGFQHQIMVDAPNWGQDWQFVMRDNAASVFAADPQRNTVFSIHMYGVFDTAAEINDYLGRFQSANLPIVVGEFGHDHSDGNPDEDTILATTRRLGIGYLGWSWSGNGGGVEYLDMVTDFNPARLTSWGQRLFNGADGIKATAVEATVYSGRPSGSPSVSISPSTSVPPAGACTATYTVTNSWPGGFQGTVTVKAGTAAITGWTVAWTWADGQRITNSWNAAVTASGNTVTARNAGYNGTLAAGAEASWGFTASRSAANTVPAPVTCTVA